MVSLPSLDSMGATFLASIRSVGTACTLASVGVYLHRRGFVEGPGKRTLALISQQVTFPLFLFSKIVYCNQDWSENPCPDVTKSLGDVWMLLFWPLYVVGCGLVVGAVVARVCKTPRNQTRSVMAAVGFANSTGLPITLLQVVHTNFPATSDLGRIDPTLFLSVYLLLYPVLQWGLGGWMLAPQEDDEEDSMDKQVELYGTSSPPGSPFSVSQDVVSPLAATTPTSIRALLHNKTMSHSARNVLNNQEVSNYYRAHRRGLSSADEGLYISEVNLVGLASEWEQQEHDDATLENGITSPVPPPPFAPPPTPSTLYEQQQHTDSTLATANTVSLSLRNNNGHVVPIPSERTALLSHRKNTEELETMYDVESPWETVRNVLERCLQPPVVGAICGIVTATTPLRGIFVDLVDREGKAPLQWFFDGLYHVGETAVPINMMILGCNLSASHMTHHHNNKTVDNDDTNKNASLLPIKTMIGIVIGKMIVMPFIGIVSALILMNYVWDIPDEIDGAFYLVLIIVFITPTANNVMVMVELSGSNTKEGIARVIALQYAVAPLILSCTMTIAIGVASNWS